MSRVLDCLPCSRMGVLEAARSKNLWSRAGGTKWNDLTPPCTRSGYPAPMPGPGTMVFYKENCCFDLCVELLFRGFGTICLFRDYRPVRSRRNTSRSIKLVLQSMLHQKIEPNGYTEPNSRTIFPQQHCAGGFSTIFLSISPAMYISCR